MNITEAKEILETVGYPVITPSDDWEDIVEELQKEYRPHVVGGSMTTLGDAAPLFMRSGNAAFMVDNKDDLYRACCRIKHILDARKATEPVKLKQDVRSRFISDIQNALESEIDIRERTKRPLGIVGTEYEIRYDPSSRTQSRKPAQIIDDLLSDDKKRIAKAVEAIRTLLIVEPA
jgi:hypothetical protein